VARPPIRHAPRIQQRALNPIPAPARCTVTVEKVLACAWSPGRFTGHDVRARSRRRRVRDRRPAGDRRAGSGPGRPVVACWPRSSRRRYGARGPLRRPRVSAPARMLVDTVAPLRAGRLGPRGHGILVQSARRLRDRGARVLTSCSASAARGRRRRRSSAADFALVGASRVDRRRLIAPRRTPASRQVLRRQIAQPVSSVRRVPARR